MWRASPFPTSGSRLSPFRALSLDEDKSLFLSFDPQFLVECPMGLPAGTKLSVTYTYYPLQLGADDTVFLRHAPGHPAHAGPGRPGLGGG